MGGENYSVIGFGVFIGALFLIYFGGMMVLVAKKASNERWSPASYRISGGIVALLGIIGAIWGYSEASGDVKENLTAIIIVTVIAVVLGVLMAVFMQDGSCILGLIILLAMIIEFVSIVYIIAFYESPDDDYDDYSYNDYDYDYDDDDDYSYFSNDYGTPSTICAVSGCYSKIASSGDTNCCAYHSNNCLECGCYIDSDAMYCMDCIEDALY